MEIKEQLLKEKMKLDSLGRITECFILPYDWEHDVSIMKEVDKNGSQMMLWGAYIFFGDVESPIVGTTITH